MAGTEFSDVLFGTPKPDRHRPQTSALWMLKTVNIVVHGHDPSLSEMICDVLADDPEMIALRKRNGRKGHHRIRCLLYRQTKSPCVSGIPMAGNFLQQENVVSDGRLRSNRRRRAVHLPGTWPAVASASIPSSSPPLRSPRCRTAEFIRVQRRDTQADNAKAIVKMAIENFKNRKPELVTHSGSQDRRQPCRLLCRGHQVKNSGRRCKLSG